MIPQPGCKQAIIVHSVKPRKKTSITTDERNMHKLIILIPEMEKLFEYEELWPQFLHQAEQMPGLRKETTSRVNRVLSGNMNFSIVHEFFFEDHKSLIDGLASPTGRQAAAILHKIARNRAVLLLAEHSEDSIENIRRYRSEGSDETTA
jgi:hypothetical protein